MGFFLFFFFFAKIEITLAGEKAIHIFCTMSYTQNSLHFDTRIHVSAQIKMIPQRHKVHKLYWATATGQAGRP